MEVSDAAAEAARAAAVARARRFLQREQARWAAPGAPPQQPPPFDVARRHAAERAAGTRQQDGYAYEGAFRYPLEVERRRWDRTSLLLERTRPGPNEDGAYVEFLARQAATVELFLLDTDLDPGVGEALDTILLGTTGAPTSQATTSWLDGTSVIAMSAGMVYLMYQAAKAVVLSWKPMPAPQGSAVSFSSRIEDAQEVLAADDAPVRLIADLLSTWLFQGVARPPTSVAPPVQYHPPLSLMTSMAERFVIAHEYGHALVDQFRLPIPWLERAADVVDPIGREYRADMFAAVVVAASASGIDEMGPNISLQGAMLAMKTHEIADRALDLARGGDGEPAWDSTTHPPFAERASLVEVVYRSLVAGEDDPRLSVDPLSFAARTADLLWQRVRPRLEEQLAAGRRLHWIWQ